MSFSIVSPESVGICSSRLARVSAALKAATDTGQPVGISALIARRGKVAYFKQFGLKDRESNEPMRGDSLFRLYSMTKPIVCTALMILYEHGKFDLLDPISKYIPAFSQLKVLQRDNSGQQQLVELVQPVAIHHLLTHTSGLAYDFYEDYSVCELYRQHKLLNDPRTSLAQFVDDLATLPLAFQPGSRWYYSVSIDVVARLIEILADQPLADFLTDHIFNPLGMTDTGFFIPKEKRNRIATMYGGVDLCGDGVSWTQLMDVWERGVNKRLDVDATYPVDDPQFARGGAGLTGSANDYLRFTQMLLNRGSLDGADILSQKTIGYMHQNHISTSLLPLKLGTKELPGYGFGLGSRVLLNAAELKLLASDGEFGWAGAAKTYYWVDPAEELIGLFLTQSMCNFSTIERNFQALTYQALID